MNVQLDELELLDRVVKAVNGISDCINPQMGILLQMKSLLVEMGQIDAANNVADSLAHMEAAKLELRKLVCESLMFTGKTKRPVKS